MFLALLSLLLFVPAEAHRFDSLTRELARNPSLADASGWGGVELDVRYATTNNFMRKNVYGPFRSCFLHREAARKLRETLTALRVHKPGWKLRVFDCLRPVRAQAELFAVVRGTPNERYVLNPAFGSLHSYGFAIDLSLSDAEGREVDMGTHYDFFGPEAEPRNESKLLEEGALTPAQLANRKLLRAVLEAGGFHAISTEWWHFDALDGSTVRARYRPVP
jgi:D-alanyl-D-alanine dipeptidase